MGAICEGVLVMDGALVIDGGGVIAVGEAQETRRNDRLKTETIIFFKQN
jgi:hypothetical protein